MEANQSEGAVDELVWDQFFLGGYAGLIVEVGAASPDFLSIGNSFRQHGWRVISLELSPIFTQQHRERGNETQEFACGTEDRDVVSLVLAEARNIGRQ